MSLMLNGIFPGELKPDASVAGCIDIFENLWPNPEQTIQLIEHECSNVDSGAYWQRAETIGSGAYQDNRTNLLLPVTHIAAVSNNSLAQNIHNQFYMILAAASLPYINRYGIKENLWHEGYSVLKYKENQEYKAHYDGGTLIGRAVSAILYLNSDFEGGEIEFVNFGIKIKPQPGMLILFPSNYAYKHIAHPIKTGTKYALVTWLRDQPFEQSK